MNKGLHHVMIGLPEAGKTTFLAALWHVLCSEEVEGSLKLARLDGDHTYLNEIRATWARASTIARTIPGKEPKLRFLLQEESSGDEIDIRVPDISGETFELAWVERSMDEQRAQLLRAISGTMLFVNPQTVRKEVLICDPEVAAAVAELDDEDDEASEEAAAADETGDAGETNEWRAELAPTQIQLVELLQFLLRLNKRRPMNVAVIVSAWDQIGRKVAPERWVKSELPLLWQFVNSVTEDLDVAYFGISAQGGDLNEDGEALKEIDTPSDRIKVVHDGHDESHDITVPLRWLMMKANI